MKKLNKSGFSVIIIAAFVLIGGYFASTNILKDTESTQGSSSQEQISQVKANLTVKYTSNQIDSFTEVLVEEGKTALDLTKKVTEVKTSGEGEMAFITSINGTIAEESKKEFWELLINGESAQVGAGSYKVKNGDSIEWRISTF